LRGRVREGGGTGLDDHVFASLEFSRDPTCDTPETLGSALRQPCVHAFRSNSLRHCKSGTIAEQTRSERLTAWLNRQAVLQPDGTYLVRPFRRLPIVYEVDPATKDRLIASQIRFGRFAIIIIVIFFLANQGQPWALTWGLLAFCDRAPSPSSA